MQLDRLASFWPELVAYTVGVLLGGIGALARWQLRRQSSAERERNSEHLKSVLDWVRLEQRDNQELIVEIRRVFERDRAARTDLLRWAVTIAQALTLDAHAELVRRPPQAPPGGSGEPGLSRLPRHQRAPSGGAGRGLLRGLLW